MVGQPEGAIARHPPDRPTAPDRATHRKERHVDRRYRSHRPTRPSHRRIPPGPGHPRGADRGGRPRCGSPRRPRRHHGSAHRTHRLQRSFDAQRGVRRSRRVAASCPAARWGSASSSTGTRSRRRRTPASGASASTPSAPEGHHQRPGAGPRAQGDRGDHRRIRPAGHDSAERLVPRGINCPRWNRPAAPGEIVASAGDGRTAKCQPAGSLPRPPPSS